MKPRIMYIEQKTDNYTPLDNKGPSWTGEVEFSQTGKTIYFNGKTFHRLKKGGIYGNYYCEETGDEYWISGVKKNGSNALRYDDKDKKQKEEKKRMMNGG